jgi:hypothetical protein
MLRYLVLATPVFWAVVLYMIWRRKRRRADHSTGARDIPRMVAGSGSTRPLARVIQLFPPSSPGKPEKNPDEKS